MPFPPAPPLIPGHRAPARLRISVLPWLGLFSSTGMAVMVSIFGLFVFPHFTEMFSSFGAELPLISRAFSRAWLMVWGGPVAVVACWYFGPPLWGPRLAGLLGLLAAALGAVCTLFAMYLPYFSMGSLV